MQVTQSYRQGKTHPYHKASQAEWHCSEATLRACEPCAFTHPHTPVTSISYLASLLVPISDFSSLSPLNRKTNQKHKPHHNGSKYELAASGWRSSVLYRQLTVHPPEALLTWASGLSLKCRAHSMLCQPAGSCHPTCTPAFCGLAPGSLSTTFPTAPH